jgi:hypothetical protein
MGCLGEAAAASLMMDLGGVSQFNQRYKIKEANIPYILAVASDAGGGLQLLTHGAGCVKMPCRCEVVCNCQRPPEEWCKAGKWRLHETDLREKPLKPINNSR